MIIIDKEEYVKVYNPTASGEGNQPKYLYIPVNEYLAKKETFASLSYRKEEPKKGALIDSTVPLLLPGTGDQFTVVCSQTLPSRFKEKGGHHLF